MATAQLKAIKYHKLESFTDFLINSSTPLFRGQAASLHGQDAGQRTTSVHGQELIAPVYLNNTSIYCPIYLLFNVLFDYCI
jgi:hypothetical protein